MRILIDECLDPGICDFLTGYQVTTVGEANWQSTADNQLIQLAQGNFDVLLTLDRGSEFQSNLEKLTFGIIILKTAVINQISGMTFFIRVHSRSFAALVVFLCSYDKRFGPRMNANERE